MLKLTDLRKTTRRSGSGDERTLHPSFLRDRSLAPRIEMAIGYLETMLDHRRSELDQAVIVQLFGDHKLARCIVACLAASYQHRCRTFAEVLPAAQMEALGAQGITTASELRLWLFRRANVGLPGFIGGIERAGFLASSGNALGLAGEPIESLITLDSPEQAILVRLGPRPTADEVITRFNYSVVAAILANARLVRLTLAKLPHQAQAIRDLCASAGVRAELTGRELVLHGQQDALDGWARRGARLVRLLVALLACGLPARSGEALVASPTGEQWLFRLSGEVLGYLGLPESEAGTLFSLTELWECWRAQDALMADYAAARRAGADAGWVLRRATEPLIVTGAILPTLLLATRGTERVPLLPTPQSSLGATQLVDLAARLPLITLQVAPNPAEEWAPRSFPDLPTLAYTAKGDMAQLPDLLAQVVGETAQRTAAQQLEAVFEQAHETGMVPEQQVAEQLPCPIEEVPDILARPQAQTLAREYHIEYVEGFGLCSTHVIMRARAVVRDLASLRQKADGAVQSMRLLGRRLREVTGASEGIECLIAYLGAA